MPISSSGRPTHEEYTLWYEDVFLDDLQSGSAEQWYNEVAESVRQSLEQSAFWRQLQAALPHWDERFKADHQGYGLFGLGHQPPTIMTKPFESVLNKSFRWNVHENDAWPEPPTKHPSTAHGIHERDRDDVQLWFGPHNWFTDFPDIFRTRLSTTYFDGVGYLCDRIVELTEELSTPSASLRLQASHDGYHAAHIRFPYETQVVDYDSRTPISVSVGLEIQVTTTIQTTINDLLHRVYEEWRITGPPPDWEWDHDNAAFAVNYLGSTLHYLEGMIVVARDKGSGA